MSRLSMLNFWKSASWGTFALFICEDESVMALTYPFHSSPLDRKHLLKLMYFFSMSKKDSTKMPSPSSSMVLRFDLSTPILSMSHHVTSFIVKPRCDCWLVKNQIPLNQSTPQNNHCLFWYCCWPIPTKNIFSQRVGAILLILGCIVLVELLRSRLCRDGCSQPTLTPLTTLGYNMLFLN